MRALAKTRPAPGAELIDRPVPSPGRGEVLLRIEAASICGTDAHLYHWDPWAAEILKPPVILGHELAGRVVDIGAGVTRVREGDLVGVESHIVDWTCRQCRSDQAHLCRNLKVIGAHVDGGFAEFAVIPEANAIESNGLDPAVVALQEPMGNAVHAAFVEPIEGRAVAVTGCGPIGLCAVAVARAAGASLVVATDVEPYRLEMAQRMGADLAIDGREADLVTRQVMEATGGDGVDVVLEMSGAQPALDTALAIITRGGRISLLGIFSRPATVDLSDMVIQKGVRLYGIYGRRLYDTWERTQALLRGGLDVSPILTHRFDLADWEQGFALIESRHAGKVVLLP
jgi:threonine 3-dehydrogenase